jgi:ribonuclease HI
MIHITFDDFRPISLCNCIYKIIAKIIARRLNPFLSEAISKEQFGFLEGRQIHEAIGLAQEGLHSLKIARSKGAILNIDLSKAYDRVNWAYIHLLLTHLGFQVPFIKWVMACISSISFAVLINGEASPFFTSERGLRQGCPLSPLLFLLVVEGLSKAIDSTARAGNFQGILVAPGMRITHLLFVDDVLIFCNGRVGDAETLDDILSLFRLATWMIINDQKSTITTSEMDGEEMAVYQIFFPFTLQDISEGIKYLGFQLKPNSYRKEDWKWLITKLEKRLNGWSFRWLSRAGRLTLTKSILEAIPVYWMSLAWIPKGVLEKIRRICARFIWSGTGDKYTQPWEKWENIAMPKALGGWGLKNIFLFSKALAAKSCWRLISVSSLWSLVVSQKYISPASIEDWIRNPNKSATNGSIIWKAMISSFSVVGDSLAWRVGKGNHLHIGVDPWPGCGNSHILLEDLIDQLHRQGIFYLSQLVDPLTTNLWNQGWKNATLLGLNGIHADLMRNYIVALRRGHIRLTDRDDELVWKKDPIGFYTPKAGYIALNIDPLQQNPKWWWKGLWKMKCPQKAKIFMWAALNNRIPTWEVLIKRQIEGPGRCALCKNANESTFHILITCPFTMKVWTETSSSLRKICIWNGDSLELAWKNWTCDPRNKEIKSLPLLISWGIWLARNARIFKEKASIPEVIVAQSLSILSHFPQSKEAPTLRVRKQEAIDSSKPWVFFDGASQNSICGGGVVLHLSNNHSFHLKMGLGRGTNNYVELMALKLLLLFTREKGIQQIQIFGDSMNVINWTRKHQTCHNIFLCPILEEIFRLLDTFDTVVISHVYRDKNLVADSLSKEGLQLSQGQWHITETKGEDTNAFYHRPFIEDQGHLQD